MAFPRLTSTGVTFADGTTLTSKYGVIPQSSVAVFYQASAPTGWTKSTTHDDKALRVVSGTGGGSGGTVGFSAAFPNSLKSISSTFPITGTVGATTIDTTTIPNHSHGNGGSIGLSPGGGDVAAGGGWSRNSPGTGGISGFTGGGSHAHPWSGTATFSSSIDVRCQYIDVIIASFN
jgi:hypothetical protein